MSSHRTEICTDCDAELQLARGEMVCPLCEIVTLAPLTPVDSDEGGVRKVKDPKTARTKRQPLQEEPASDPAMVCSYCAHELQPNQKACGECGTAMGC